MSPYCTAAAASSTVFCGGRPSITETSPNWRSPSTSTTGSVERLAIAAATLIAMQVLPTPPLVENTDDQAAGLAGRASPEPAVARRRRAGEQLAHAVDRLVEARLAADHHRVARAGAQRLLEHVGRQLVDREHRAELRVRAGERGARAGSRSGWRSRDRRPPRPVAPGRAAGPGPPSSRTARRRRARPRAASGGVASGSTTATSKPAASRRRRRPWRRTPLALPAARRGLGAARRAAAELVGGSSTR